MKNRLAYNDCRPSLTVASLTVIGMHRSLSQKLNFIVLLDSMEAF